MFKELNYFLPTHLSSANSFIIASKSTLFAALFSTGEITKLLSLPWYIDGLKYVFFSLGFETLLSLEATETHTVKKSFSTTYKLEKDLMKFITLNS